MTGHAIDLYPVATATRTLTRRRPAGHPDWCAGGHRCGLGEHRADPVTVTRPTGSVVLTRVRSTTGRQFAEVRLSLALVDDDPAARYQLGELLGALVDLLDGGGP